MLVLFAPQCGDSGRAEDDDPRSFLMFEMFEWCDGGVQLAGSRVRLA